MEGAMRTVAALLAVLILALPSLSCRESITRSTSIEPSPEDDLARLALMEQAIRMLIGTPTCEDVSQCHTAPLGVKPCGGPWKYLIYSTQTIDPAALQRAIDHHDAFNAEINRRHHFWSDCALVLEPQVKCTDHVCVERN
jgi:hypothetical protein